jgi:hypothetical protein
MLFVRAIRDEIERRGQRICGFRFLRHVRAQRLYNSTTVPWLWRQATEGDFLHKVRNGNG